MLRNLRRARALSGCMNKFSEVLKRPAAQPVRRVCVVVNPNGGSVPADWRGQIDAVLGELGVTARFEVIDHDCEEACARAGAAEADAILVWGGDGTIACALNTLGRTGAPVLPIAGGTMNMFHKLVHGDDLALRTCLTRTLTHPVEMDVAAGEVEGHHFYVGALLGGLTRLAAPREALRKAEIVQAVTQFGEADAFSLDTPMRYSPDGADAHDAQALGIFLSENPARPGFDVLATAPESLLDLAYTGLTGLLADWRNAWGMDRGFAESVDVEALEATGLEATLDGEPATLPVRTHFTLVRQAARVLTAADA